MNDGVILALLPRGSTGETHCTLVYGGTVGEDAPHPTVLAKSAMHLARGFMPFDVTVTGHDMFGQEKDEPVNLIDSHHLHAMRHFVNHHNRSEFKDFKPHISVNEDTPHLALGSKLRMDRLALWYGEDRWSWALGTGEPRAPQ